VSDDPKPAAEPQSWEGPELEFENGLEPGVPLLFQATKIGGLPAPSPGEADEPERTEGLVEFRASFTPR
jgi:hypothetical protein